MNTRVAVGGRALDDLARLVRSPYLPAIMAFIVVAQILGALMYNEQARYVETAYENLAGRAALLARIDLASNVLSLGAADRDRRLAHRTRRHTCDAHRDLAAVCAVFRRTGLFKPAREMLFTVLSPETKFKRKSLLDTALHRGTDSLGNGVYLLVAPLGLAGIAGASASACVLLTMGCSLAGGRFHRTGE